MDAIDLQSVLHVLMWCAVFGYVAWRKHRQKANLAMYRGLREIFYSAAPEVLLGDRPGKPGEVIGVAMDWPIKDTQATVIAFIDGTGSLYMKRQGSAICGGYGAPELARAFVAEAASWVARAEKVDAHPEPDPATVYFYIRTTDALYRVSDSVSALLVGKGAAEPLFVAGNDLMTALFKMADTAEKVPERA
ncbi:hypothetical protein GCM10007933_10630 [Zoogloea oryzae]|uniref:Uncharacterized protein n=1 Tax=Zoogloea oryzae TaxID=310767 RepID=A0ABQ6F9M3_9RHOO|nr:hypothetical protein [Zoogloea oryzae]GLT21611.1 hypothetical protein GCM10007933_10630 [Zoogloea oryzae]